MNKTTLINMAVAACAALMPSALHAIDHPGITFPELSSDRFTLVENGVPLNICVSPEDNSAVKIAADNLAGDFGLVTGTDARILDAPEGKTVVIAGSLGSPIIDGLIKKGLIDASELKGKREKYIMTTLANPYPGVNEALVIAGSDRRGAVYGIYELSEQIGVSPWYDWADVPVEKRTDLSIKRGTYTAGEPAVAYRGIFLNDEAPCLTGWVKNTYGTEYGDHRFYERVFELILRLRGNYMWPAMWGWAFYADDPENGPTADSMGVIMGTSHHEPMARNHQEWARHRKEYGVWDYATNQAVIDKFFREGIERSKDTEDVITIGMRGDGDAPMGGNEGKDHEYVPQYERNIRLLQKIFKNQRKIIKDVTGKDAGKRQQVWAIYKEVQDLYDRGLRAPDDVIYLLCDDNWGNVRRLPNAEERKHPGGWGIYYHVDYVGAPRNSKLINCTPIQNMWEQLKLTYDYGVDKLWILNVGDLKPMEYPITLFLDMAWNPDKYNAATINDHTVAFCSRQFGEEQGPEAARILNLLCKYNGRITPEMLDSKTYSLENGEWRKVCDEYARLEAEALRQYLTLKPEQRDAYQQIILFPLQLMGNLYDMYYAQAMNDKLYKAGDPEANMWADKVESCFKRDAELMKYYNKTMSNGKWDGMMTQKHIGYTSWNDNFPSDTMPKVNRVESDTKGGYVFAPGANDGCVVIEAEHFYRAVEPESDGRWTVLPYVGRTLSGVSVMPYTDSVAGAKLEYAVKLPAGVKTVKATVALKSTLALPTVTDTGSLSDLMEFNLKVVNFNGNLNENPENVYSIYYPTVARRVVDRTVELTVPEHKDDAVLILSLSPLDPGAVFEKIVLDYGGYTPSYLYGEESPKSVKR